MSLGLAMLAVFGVAEPSVDLRWTAPESCPGQEPVADRLQRRLADRLTETDQLVVDGRIETAAQELRLTLTVDYNGKVSRRALTAAQCEDLVASVMLFAALAVDPAKAAVEAQHPTDLVVHNDDSADESARSPTLAQPVEPPQPRAAPSQEPPADRRPPLQAELGAGAGPAWGRVPHTSAALQVRVGLGRPRWTVGVSANYFTPRTQLVAGFGDRGVRVQAWSVEVAAGPRFALHPRVSLVVAAGLDAGGMYGQGFGVDDTRAGTRAWLAALVGARLEVRAVGPVHAWLGTDVAIPFWRPAFEIEGRGIVHRAGVVAPRALLGLMARVPRLQP